VVVRSQLFRSQLATNKKRGFHKLFRSFVVLIILVKSRINSSESLRSFVDEADSKKLVAFNNFIQ
jgi:hypothetical protein